MLRHRLRLTRLVAALAIAAVAFTVAPADPGPATVDAAPAPADTFEADIDFQGDFTYTVDPAAGVVHVRASLYLAHNNRALYYTSHPSVAYVLFNVPANAVIVSSSQHGPVPQWQAIPDRGRTVTAIKPQPIAGSDDEIRLEIDLRCCLNYTYHLRLDIEYDVPGLPPRSSGATRVNDAYVGFDAFTIGDDGVGSITVVTPSNYLIDTLGSEWSRTTVDGITTYRLDKVTDANQRSWYVAAHDENALVDNSISVNDADFRVRAWPSDSEWSPFVTDTVTDGVPVLEELIGQPWPFDDVIDITESHTPNAFGYAGWFSLDDNTIEIDEQFDKETVLHELSHAWFNRAWFSDRWLVEGFAETFGNLAVAEIDPTLADEPDELSTAAPGYVALNAWADLGVDVNEPDREQYGYNAAWSVVQQIIDEIGLDATASIFEQIASDAPSYAGDDPSETANMLTDWRRFLDLAENVGGSDAAAGLFEDYVVEPADTQLLDARANARDAYDALVAESGEWAVPEVIRDGMAKWEFDDAERNIAAAHELLVVRDELDALAAEGGFGYGPELEAAYEQADHDLDDVTALLNDTLDTARQLRDAVHAANASHGIFGTIGLIGNDLDSTLDRARSALTTGDLGKVDSRALEVLADVDDSSGVGLVRSAVAVGVVLVTLFVTLFLRRRRRTTHDAPVEDVPDEDVPVEDVPAEDVSANNGTPSTSAPE